MWSVEYVQVPDENQQKPIETSNPKDTVALAARQLSKEATSQPIEIAKRRRSSCNSYNGDIQTAVDRLKDFKDPDYIAAKQVELGSSVDSNSIFMANLQETIGNSGRTDEGREVAIDREDSNVSRTSSISDLGNADEIGNQDNEMNRDGEVQSQKSEVSVASAMDAFDMAENIPSEKPGESAGASEHVDVNQPVLLDLEKVTNNLGSGTKEIYEEGKSPSSEFEVISETEVKTSVGPSADDVVRKYRRKTKNTLREGEDLISLHFIMLNCLIILF